LKEDDVDMDEDEMTFEELRAVMLSGTEAHVNPGPRPVLAKEPGEPLKLAASFHITGTSRLGRPIKLVQVRRPMLVRTH
jgi:hypothetical protein